MPGTSARTREKRGKTALPVPSQKLSPAGGLATARVCIIFRIRYPAISRNEIPPEQPRETHTAHAQHPAGSPQLPDPLRPSGGPRPGHDRRGQHVARHTRPSASRPPLSAPRKQGPFSCRAIRRFRIGINAQNRLPAPCRSGQTTVEIKVKRSPIQQLRSPHLRPLRPSGAAAANCGSNTGPGVHSSRLGTGSVM